MNLLGFNLTYEPKGKEPKATPEALIAVDRDFLFRLAIFIVLYGTFVTVCGMALAHSARR